MRDKKIRTYLSHAFRMFLPAFADELKYRFQPCIALSPASQAVMEEAGIWLSMLEFAPRKTVDADEICEKLEEIFSLPELVMPASAQHTARTLIQMRLWPILRILSYLNVHYPEKIQEEALKMHPEGWKKAKYLLPSEKDE